MALAFLMGFLCISGCVQQNYASEKDSWPAEEARKFAEAREEPSGPESVSLGPYKVSFNLNTTQDYGLHQTEPERQETDRDIEYLAYNLVCLGRDGNQMEVSLNRFGQEIDQQRSFFLFEDSVKEMMREEDYGNVVVNRTSLDGRHKASVIYGTNSSKSQPDLWVAYYWPADRPGQRLVCTVYSDFPWKETKSLLETLHVEVPR